MKTGARTGWFVFAATAIFVAGYLVGLRGDQVSGPRPDSDSTLRVRTQPGLSGTTPDLVTTSNGVTVPRGDDAKPPTVGESPEVLEKEKATARPGLSVFKAKLAKHKPLDGLRGGFPNPEELEAIYEERAAGYARRITDGRVRALRAILGRAWNDEALEQDVRSLYEDWANRKWLVHRDLHLAQAAVREGSEASPARFKQLLELRQAWAKRVADLRLELKMKMSHAIPWRVYEPNEDLVDRVLRLDE